MRWKTAARRLAAAAFLMGGAFATMATSAVPDARDANHAAQSIDNEATVRVVLSRETFEQAYSLNITLDLTASEQIRGLDFSATSPGLELTSHVLVDNNTQLELQLSDPELHMICPPETIDCYVELHLSAEVPFQVYSAALAESNGFATEATLSIE